jgi:hypothetical protein
VRLGAIANNPDANTLQQWDDNDAYSAISLMVDGIGIVSARVTLPKSIGSLRSLLAKRALLASAEEMQAMNRAQRTQAMAAAIAKFAETPEGKTAVVTAMKDAGINEAQIAAALKKGVDSFEKGTAILATIAKPTAQRLSKEPRSILITRGNCGASATPAVIAGSASGIVNFVIVHTLARPQQSVLS